MHDFQEASALWCAAQKACIFLTIGSGGCEFWLRSNAALASFTGHGSMINDTWIKVAFRSAACNPMLGSRSLAKDERHRHFCVGFEFDGLAKNDSFKNLRGGHLLDLKAGIYILLCVKSGIKSIAEEWAAHDEIHSP